MTKPTCKKCRQPHWGFVPCEKAAALNEQETYRDAELAKTKVIPVPKHDRPPTAGLRTFRQVGVNRFVKEREG